MGPGTFGLSLLASGHAGGRGMLVAHKIRKIFQFYQNYPPLCRV